MDGLRLFLNSETHEMLADNELRMWHYILFDLWENEIVTGDPRNSLYLRGGRNWIRSLSFLRICWKTMLIIGIQVLDEKNLTDFVYSMYEMYHSEAIENAFSDLDSLINTGRTAW